MKRTDNHISRCGQKLDTVRFLRRHHINCKECQKLKRRGSLDSKCKDCGIPYGDGSLFPRGKYTWCKPCQAKYSSQKYRKRPEVRFRWDLMTLYGITLEFYQEMLDRQLGKCAICKSDSSGRRDAKRFSVDHDHVSGIVRGLLCANCNLLLGHAKDNPQILALAQEYLLRANNG